MQIYSIFGKLAQIETASFFGFFSKPKKIEWKAGNSSKKKKK
jgi:hypothetical protein